VPEGERGEFLDSAIGGLIHGAVPFSRGELAVLQTVYSALDEPDGIAGISILRSQVLVGAGGGGGGGGGGGSAGAFGGGGDAGADDDASTIVFSQARALPAAGATPAATALEALSERTTEAEHDARWTDALMAYEHGLYLHAALRDKERAARRGEGEGEGEGEGGSGGGGGGGGEEDSDVVLVGEEGPRGGLSAASSSSAVAPPSEADLHAGLLRSLQNLGHLEVALNHGIGVVARRPDLAAVVTPYAVEAAWRLGQWEPLEQLLAFDDSARPVGSAPASSSFVSSEAAAGGSEAPGGAAAAVAGAAREDDAAGAPDAGVVTVPSAAPSGR
jgi:hypothetical protein